MQNNENVSIHAVLNVFDCRARIRSAGSTEDENNSSKSAANAKWSRQFRLVASSVESAL